MNRHTKPPQAVTKKLYGERPLRHRRVSGAGGESRGSGSPCHGRCLRPWDGVALPVAFQVARRQGIEDVRRQVGLMTNGMTTGEIVVLPIWRREAFT